MGTFSVWHWLVVLAVVVLVFGTKKLRNLGGDLGAAVRGFKQGMKENGTDGDGKGLGKRRRRNRHRKNRRRFGRASLVSRAGIRPERAHV